MPDLTEGYDYTQTSSISARSLQQFGINMLTGEAENIWGLGRLLCDVNQQGKKLIERYFGGTVEVRAGSNWNPMVNGEPAVGSIMLADECIANLFVFCALMTKRACQVRECTHDFAGEITVFFETDKALGEWLELAASYVSNTKVYSFGSGGTSDRSVHQMSGREV